MLGLFAVDFNSDVVYVHISQVTGETRAAVLISLPQATGRTSGQAGELPAVDQRGRICVTSIHPYGCLTRKKNVDSRRKTEENNGSRLGMYVKL